MAESVPLPVLTPDGRPAEEQPRWRHDFPIDTDEDSYIARRDFTKFLVLTSFAFVVGQFWIVAHALRRGRGSTWVEKRIAASGDIPVGGALGFTYPEHHDPCLLIRVGEGDFVAYGSKCTHLACAVLPDVAAGELRCPCHHGLFDLANGRPLAGPPRRPLPRILIERRGNEIFAMGVEERTV